MRGQEPITLPPNSEPEPDVVVARRQSDHYLSAHPSPKDILLVIEVADSSLQYDQQTKLALYAEAGISDYWLFNLIENHLEVYSEPVQDVQGNSSYRLRRIILPDEVVALPSLPDLSLNLSSVFPSYPQQTQTSAYSGTAQ